MASHSISMKVREVLRCIGQKPRLRDGEVEKIDRLIERLDSPEQDLDSINDALEIISYYATEFAYELSGWTVSVAIVQGARHNQEDTWTIRTLGPEITAFAIFDGHGGDSVSTHARDTFLKKLDTKIATKITIEDALRDTFREFGDEEVKQVPGSTATIVVIDQRDPENSTFTVGNVGDSPCVIHTTDNRIRRVSIDHKPTNPDEIMRIQAAGGFIAFDRLNSTLAVSQAFGDSMVGKGLAYEGSYLTLDLKDIDCFFLASDGVSDAFYDKEAIRVVMDPSIKSSEMAKCLVEEAVARRRFQADNTTAVVLSRVLPASTNEYDDMSSTASLSSTEPMDDDPSGFN